MVWPVMLKKKRCLCVYGKDRGVSHQTMNSGLAAAPFRV